MQGPLRLIVETSTASGSLVLASGNEAPIRRDFFSDRSHNAMLFQPLAELMKMRENQSLEIVLVGSGPGSYSGTRVGIAAAQGVAIACGCPAVSLPSILAVPCVENGETGLAIGDARRGSYWTAAIENRDLAYAPELTDEAGLREKIRAALDQGARVFSFEAPDRFPLDAGIQKQILLETPDAERLWQAWQQASSSRKAEWTAMIPQPLYLKPPHITPGKKPAWF